MLVVLIGGGGYLAFSSMQKYSLSSETSDIDQQTANQTASPGKSTTESKRYVSFSDNSLEENKSTRRVLFFYANWCPTCRPADASFTQNEAKIPSDVTVIRVNYNDTETTDEEKALSVKYGVTYQHTFVQIDTNDQVVTKWNGGQISELLENIK